MTKVTVNFEGAFFVHHSLGMVNRELISELLEDPEFDIRIKRSENDQFSSEVPSRYAKITQLPVTPHEHPQINIRHHWPPNFSKAPSGKLIVIFPWEYGSLPEKWRDQIVSNVDEIWVPSTFLKKCYINSGVPSEKICVVPNGIDAQLFNSQCKPSSDIDLLKKDCFCFLFNGGTTLRKGIDILVNAYLNEFKAGEKVCLIIKDSFSYGKELAAKIQQLCNRSDIATLHYLLKNFNHEDLPSLYKSCDCYVHPYRAEGYGLPVAEALACGRPVIVTGNGASVDFVSNRCGYFIDSTLEYMKEKSISGLNTVNYPFWYVPDMRHVQQLMRHVFNNRSECSQKGMIGEILMKSSHTWHHASLHARERLKTIANS